MANRAVFHRAYTGPGTNALNTWKSWELLKAIWWNTGPPTPNPAMGGEYFTLADYMSKNPTAKIINEPGTQGTGGIRLNIGFPAGSVGYYGTHIKANSDKFTIGVNGKTTIYDFELNIANAGESKTVNYGYGSNCTTLHGTAAGGVAPYTYSWSAGNSTWNSQDVGVCPTTTTTYTLTTTDANGCKGTDQVIVYVNDVRCGPNNDQVVLCHNGKDVCVPQTEVAFLLEHGYSLGSVQLQLP